MAYTPLRKWQKNDLYLLISSSSFQPSNFSWNYTEDEGDFGTRHLITLTYSPSEFEFFISVMQNSDRYYIQFSPGKFVEKVDAANCNWEQLTEQFSDWLECLKLELETSDLWETVTPSSDLVRYEVSPEEESSHFSDNERFDIAQGVEEIKHYIEALSPEHIERVEAVHRKLDYLIGAAERVSKKDWIMLAVGTMVSIITQLALPQAAASDLMRFAGQVFQKVIHTVASLP